MKKNTILSFMASAIMSGLGYANKSDDLTKDEIEILHRSDLRERLQNVANKAKRIKSEIGSTLPYMVVAKRSRKTQQEIQFEGKINENGLHQYYLKDGIMVARF